MKEDKLNQSEKNNQLSDESEFETRKGNDYDKIVALFLCLFISFQVATNQLQQLYNECNLLMMRKRVHLE